jgi:hypothetical protein
MKTLRLVMFLSNYAKFGPISGEPLTRSGDLETFEGLNFRGIPIFQLVRRIFTP